MKRSVIASVLGIAAAITIVNKSQAQGYVYFGNYTGGLAITAPVTYSGASAQGLVNGENVGYTSGSGDPTFTAELLYSYGANLGVTYSDTGITAPFLSFDGDTVSDGGGLFGGSINTVSIPGYTSGAADFEIEVYNGASYATSTIRGTSGVVSIGVLATSANELPTGSMFSDNGNVTAPLTPFTVSLVGPAPEPGTLALAGLGGLASLVAMRRRKA